MQRHAVVRADGGHEIGTGHLARTLLLADRLKESGARVTFASYSVDGCAALLQRCGHELVLLPPISQGSSARAASAVCALEPGLIVNDIRDTSAEYMRRLCTSGAGIVNFDDRGEGAALADVLVDANRRPEEAAGAPNACVLFGPDYIVLDERFDEAHGRPKAVRDRVEEVLVFMGGSDPAGLTLRALDVLEQLDPEWHTTVVLGYAFRDREEAQQRAARVRNADVVVGPADLAARMAQADMALCSGGIAMFELACVGTPSIVWCQVPHEFDNARLLAERGIVRCLGLGDEVAAGAAADALAALANDAAARRAMSEAGKRTVDGRGLGRVMEAIEQCVRP
jgi:spore coat polysaccharide biosynthesis predicted glycosyltransferase SpsG